MSTEFLIILTPNHFLNNISVETDCPLDTSSTGVCYDRGFKNKQLMRCSDQCLGGCLTKDEKGEDIHNLDYTQDECFSCKNYLSPLSASQFSDRGNHVCWMECTEGYVSVGLSIIYLFKTKH